MPEEAAEHGESLIHVAIKAETLFHLGPIAVTNSMVGSLIVFVLLVSLAWWASRNHAVVPSRLREGLPRARRFAQLLEGGGQMAEIDQGGMLLRERFLNGQRFDEAPLTDQNAGSQGKQPLVSGHAMPLGKAHVAERFAEAMKRRERRGASQVGWRVGRRNRHRLLRERERPFVVTDVARHLAT